jgi:HlyD family secretion protein
MDVVRKGVNKRKIIGRVAIGCVLLCMAAGVTWAVGRMQPALPLVEAGSVWPDTVKRGPMVRQVHGIGSLVPREVTWISAQVDGRVEKIHIQPGTPVDADTVIMDLSNPTLNQAMIGAEYDLKQAEAAFADLEITLQSTKYDKQAAAAQVTSDYEQAKIKAERDGQLAAQGLIPALDLKLSLAQARELEFRNQIEEKRLGTIDKSTEAQLTAQRVRIDQLRAVYQLKREQVDQLHVKSGVSGMLQQIGNTNPGAPLLEAGQNVAAGTILARVAGQNRLKAQIRVTETEAKDILLGQEATIDTHNGNVAGKVIRIDPAAVNGTVLVDVGLTGALPAGARPDLSVDGTVEIEHLNEVLYIARPAAGQPNTSVSLFKIDSDGHTATRTSVKLGRASVNTIEIVNGLREGEKVIISDMNAMDSHERIRLN